MGVMQFFTFLGKNGENIFLINETIKNRRLRVTISRTRRHAPFEPIGPKTCVWGGVPDVINCANFFENRSRGLGAGIPRKTAFTIESVHRPYNSVSNQQYRAAL